jgi:hypothetical protein
MRVMSSGNFVLTNFIFSLALFGQIFAFFNEELAGFLFVTFYFVIFPIIGIALLASRFYLTVKRRFAEREDIICFLGLLFYFFVLWRWPLVGSAAVFLSDYKKLDVLVRLPIFILTSFGWCYANIKILKRLL